MQPNHIKNNTFQISTVRSIKNNQKQDHICPDIKVRSRCHLVVKVRNSPKSASDLTAIGFKALRDVYPLLLLKAMDSVLSY